MDTLYGVISNQRVVLQGKLTSPKVVGSGSDILDYEGEYEVTPGANEQVLETANKKLAENIIIDPIPYAEVSNNSGGKTITIGGK